MSNTSRRRYKIGLHKSYDEAFDYAKGRSAIFQPWNVAFDRAWIADALSNRKGVLKLLQIWKGDETGSYAERGQRMPSLIREVQDGIDQLQVRFEHRNQSLVNRGKAPLKEFPPGLQKEQFQLEGRYDVIQSEISHLEKKLATFTEVESATKSKDILRYGPQGSGKLKGGILVEIDAQPVQKNDDGLLYINCSESRYNRMLTQDYIERVVKVWKINNAKLLNEYVAKAREENRNTNNEPRPQAPWPKVPEGIELVEVNAK